MCYVYNGSIQCATWGTVRPIEEYEFPRLHPQLYDRRVELKKLIQSVAVAFLDLLDILAKSPNSPQRGQRIDDLGLLVRAIPKQRRFYQLPSLLFIPISCDISLDGFKANIIFA